MDAITLHAVAAFVAGLIITLVLAAYLTPRGWWKRPNARALFIMVAGAWGFGSMILYATHAPATAAGSARAAPTHTAALPSHADDAVRAGDSRTVGQPFRVHRDLNLRAAPGVQSTRVIVVPAGAIVTPTGQHDGDWWQVSTVLDGRTQTGWASSLWLRRSGE
ncbi:SH3 domain-containing protein [Duganella sp. CF402]|uniref:SH3 domain-containing protein n=1 Tax=unclassified Duganella TaxID=2636909 RepID=UPI0008C89D64|nr:MULTISPECIES: SH3 domain-containing protein [unclassified Duganella]RZT10877.1 SH3 domain-containing protein [Duganella sp. BK701]SEK92322.1 SH3 domain-containing protein [Duganella sp. CF402]